MNKFFTTALAGSLVCATGFASETEWPELDRELEALSSTLSTLDGGPSLGGWGIIAYDNNSDGDVGDFALRSVRLNASGSNGDYGYFVSLDAAGGVAGLVDAYATFGIGGISAQMGVFRAPTLTSALIDRNQTFFIDRSMLGAAGSARDAGLMVSGDMGTVGWWLAVMDGSDGGGDEYEITGRVAVDLMGDGANGSNEGAYGAGDGTCLSAALAFQDDGGDDSSSMAVEAYFTSGPFSASVEAVDNDDADTTAGCEAPEGYVAVEDGWALDCDDDNASTHPGADETCNEVDDDCDGAIDGAAVCGTLITPIGENDAYAAAGGAGSWNRCGSAQGCAQ
ncbi:MAG: putative metal-binding motif-containing protein, partial [Planctomycetota bacterium]|nr:putative metal-binding motif-containing protein [Planctomycetota bacterium]